MLDAAVIGGGPAGAIAARDLARAGARVALVDGSHPREKPCGGGVTARALALAGCDVPGGRAVDIVTFEAGGKRAAVRMPDGDHLRVFSRAAFDTALFDEARDAGAEIVPARATSFARDASAWRIQSAAGELRAAWLLGADGAGGLTRKALFKPFDRRQLSIAAGSYVDRIDTTEIVIAFVDRPRGYLWSFPRDGHLAVGTCAQADETTTAQMHAVTDRWLDAYPGARDRPRRRYAWPIPSLSGSDLDAEIVAGKGWMLLGDAAGLVDPITREGIFFAVRSGQLAAGALQSGDSARRFAEAVRDDLHAELRRAARLKAGFYRPRFTHLLIDALESSAAIRAVMVDLVAGRQPYAGLKRRLVGTLEVGLMCRLMTSFATKPRGVAS